MRLNKIDLQILAIAIPAIITNITTPLLGLMDVAITGHLGKAEYIAAIAIGGNIFNMLYWIFSFLRSGTSGMTANAFGARDNSKIYATLYRALIVACAAGLIIIFMSKPIVSIFIKWMDVDLETAIFTTRYFNILVFGAPAFLASYAISGWLIGMQDSRSAMWMSLFINVTNIIVSLSLVVGLKMKIEGVAWGTLSAQWGGALFGAILILRKYRLIKIPFSILKERTELLQFFKISRDLMIRTLCLVAVTLWFTRVGASQGTTVLAANTLLLQFFLFFSYFSDGFAYAGEALCGRYKGENNIKTLIKAEQHLLIWGLGIAFIFLAIYGLGGNMLLSLLSDDHQVILKAREYLVWLVMLPLLGFSAFVYDGVFIGLTSTAHLMLSMAISAAIYFISYILLFPILQNHGLWIAFLLYLLTRGLYLAIVLKRINNRLKTESVS